MIHGVDRGQGQMGRRDRERATDSPEYGDLLADMTAAGGPLTPQMASDLTPGGGLNECIHLQDTARALARPKRTGHDIFWLKETPTFLRVYEKPNMGVDRRVAWIVFRAATLKVPLTPVTFMAFFKQVSCSTNDTSRYQAYLAAITLWKKGQGKDFEWKKLLVASRIEIQDINTGTETCYCRACKVVLDRKNTTQFCSSECRVSICNGCNEPVSEKMVPDHDATDALQTRMGMSDTMLHLSTVWIYRSTIFHWQAVEERNRLKLNAADINMDTGEGMPTDFEGHLQLAFEDRDRENCCKRIRTGYITNTPPWCKPCVVEYKWVRYLSGMVHDLDTGKYTMGHAEMASRRLREICDTPDVMKKRRFCGNSACEFGPK